MLRLMLLALFLFLAGCLVEHDEVIPQKFNMMNYYRTNDEFQYSDTVQTPLTILDSIPKISLEQGDLWRYYNYSGYLDTFTLTLDTVLNDSMVRFYWSKEEREYTVQLSPRGYSAIDTGSDSVMWDSDTLLSFLPLPHESVFTHMYAYIPIQLDDGTYAYELGEAIYFSDFGRLSLENGCLVGYNDLTYGDIARKLNEFEAKEYLWYQ